MAVAENKTGILWKSCQVYLLLWHVWEPSLLSLDDRVQVSYADSEAEAELSDSPTAQDHWVLKDAENFMINIK